MDTIKQAANASGNEQSGTEPLSGRTGDVSKGEPYDAGNSDSTETQRTTTTSGDMNDTRASHTNTSSTGNANPTPAGDTKTSDDTLAGQEAGPKSSGMGNTPATAPIHPHADTDKTGVTGGQQHHPDQAFKSDRPSNANDSSGPPGVSAGADPASGQQPTQKQQGADRPEEEPSSDEHARIAATKKEAEEAAKVDTSGPGPRPLTEVAGKPGGASSSGGDDDGPQKESHGEGTGEKYVKSTGMAADGGDFDAAKPGAGKEADRLLETKGVQREAPGKTGDGDHDPLEDKINKPGLKEKLTSKLHSH